MSRPGRKRLSMDLPDKIHSRVKGLARRRNCTVTKWVLRAIIAQIIEETRHERQL